MVTSSPFTDNSPVGQRSDMKTPTHKHFISRIVSCSWRSHARFCPEGGPLGRPNTIPTDNTIRNTKTMFFFLVLFTHASKQPHCSLPRSLPPCARATRLRFCGRGPRRRALPQCSQSATLPPSLTCRSRETRLDPFGGRSGGRKGGGRGTAT